LPKLYINWRSMLFESIERKHPCGVTRVDFKRPIYQPTARYSIFTVRLSNKFLKAC
jgi:hypothetical protein